MATGFEQQRDDVHRAIGRYFAEFSLLIFWMRHMMIDKLGGNRPGMSTIASLVFGEATAYAIYTSFFAVCTRVATLDPDEDQIAARLSKEVADVTSQRNDLAHGDWLIGGTDGVLADPTLWRTKPSKRKGSHLTFVHTAETLDAASDALIELRRLVGEFGAICLQQSIYDPRVAPRLGLEGLRVRDIFKLEGRKNTGLRVVRRADVSHRAPPCP